MVKVYTDGSYNKETDITGAGLVVVKDGKVLRKSFVVETEENHSWNIDGECHAVLEALLVCSGEKEIEGQTIKETNIEINYDYLGIEKWITKEWKAKSKISRVYLEEFNKIKEKYNLNVTFNKIKAHSGDVYNEMADELAKQAIERS